MKSVVSRRRPSHRRRRAAWAPAARRRRFAVATVPILEVAGAASGLFRVSDAELARFEVYRGVDASPDFDADPWQTFTALPFTTPALDPGFRYTLVVRRRNAWGVVSRNVEETVVDLDGDGVEQDPPPSDVVNVAIAAAAGGTVRVTAEYEYDADGDLQADAFLVFLRSDGTDPDPDSDAPAEVAMAKGDGVARLDYTSSAFNEGDTVKVILRTRRSGTPDADSASVAVLTATATLLGPEAVEGTASLGGLYLEA